MFAIAIVADLVSIAAGGVAIYLGWKVISGHGKGGDGGDDPKSSDNEQYDEGE